MLTRLAVMCHLFGGLTPAGVWALTYRDFRQLARFADDWVKSQQKE